MNELDQFVKHELRIKQYLRYADDFIILAKNRGYLYQCINTLKQFLHDRLKLELHPDKIMIKRLWWGVDFCGYVVLPHFRKVRTRTKKRIFKKVLNSELTDEALASYLGYFSHAKAYKISQNFKNIFWLFKKPTIL